MAPSELSHRVIAGCSRALSHEARRQRDFLLIRIRMFNRVASLARHEINLPIPPIQGSFQVAAKFYHPLPKGGSYPLAPCLAMAGMN
jgi:hypothetical protein